MCNSARSFQMHLVKCCIRPVARTAGAYLSSLNMKRLQLSSIFTPPGLDACPSQSYSYRAWQKASSGHLRKVHFPDEPVTCYSHVSNGHPGKLSAN